MSISCHYKPEHRVTVFVHRGIVPDDEFLQYYRSFYSDSSYDKSFDLLIDLRGTQSGARSPEALKKFAAFAQLQVPKVEPEPKVAVIAPKDMSFGLARMFEAYSDLVPFDFSVLRDSEKAIEWLNVEGDILREIREDE